MVASRLSSEVLVYNTATEYNADVAAGRVLARHQQAFLTYAAAGQPQWLRGTGQALTADPSQNADVMQIAGQQGSSGGGYAKVQITALNSKFTYALHNRSIVHVESGASLVAVPMLASDWQASGAFLETDFYIINNTSNSLTFNVETGATKFTGLLELGGDEQVTGFAIPAGYMAHVFTDADGFVQISLAGEAVTNAELTAGLNLKQNTADRVAAMTGNTADDTKYPSAKLVYDHVAAKRGSIGAAIAASVTLTAWDAIHSIDASAGAVVVTLPSSASVDGELLFSRIDNSANVVAIRPSGNETFQGVPTNTTHITLRPTGSLRMRATATGPARLDWAMPDQAARLWLPGDASVAPAVWYSFRNFASLTLVGTAISGVANLGGLGATYNLAQAVVGARPVIDNVATPQYATFDGNDDMLSTSAAPVQDSDQAVLAMLYTASGAKNASVFRQVVTTGTQINFHPKWSDNSTYLDLPLATARISVNLGTQFANGATNPIAAVGYRSGAAAALHGMGNTTAAMSGASSSGTPSGAGQINLGHAGTGVDGLSGRIYEILFYRAALTSLDREQLAAYMLWSINQQGLLHTSNSFRNAPPLQAIVQF